MIRAQIESLPYAGITYYMLTSDVVTEGTSHTGSVSFPSEGVGSPAPRLALTRDAIEVAPLTTFCAPVLTVFTRFRPLSSGSPLLIAMKNIPQMTSSISRNGKSGRNRIDVGSAEIIS